MTFALFVKPTTCGDGLLCLREARVMAKVGEILITLRMRIIPTIYSKIYSVGGDDEKNERKYAILSDIS